MKRTKVTALLCAAVCLVSLNGCGRTEHRSSSAVSDAPSASKLPAVHSFQIELIDGSTYTESLLSKADVTVINIWQTTCPPCIKEMPDLALLEESLPDHVRLMTWCLDGSYNSAKAKQILSDAGYRGMTITGWDGDLNNLLGQIMYTPTTIFLDSEGNMACEEIIGAGDVLGEYTERINSVLRAKGKDEIKL